MAKLTTVAALFDKYANDYQDKFMDMDLYHDTFDLFCQVVKKANARILEIGCGPGNITRYILSKRPDFLVEGIDLAPNMVELAQKNNPTARFSTMDCRDIDQLTGPFDAVLCGFCLPYLSKEESEKLIKDCSNLLHPGGALYISTMEDDYDKSGYQTSSNGQDSLYMYFHQEDYLQEMLKAQHFEVVDLRRKDYPKPDGTFSIDMIFIARKMNT